MGKPSTPAAPDYTGAAQQQGQSSIESAIANALLNRANQYTPAGSQTWEQSGSTTLPGTGTAATAGHWEAAPAGAGPLQGGAFGGRIAIPGSGRGNGQVWVPGTPASADYKPGTTIPQFSSHTTLSPEEQAIFDQNQATRGRLAGAADAATATPFSLSGLPSDYNKSVADAMYNRSSAMLDPQWEQNETRSTNKLLNSGFSVGDTGYTKAQDDFQRQKGAAYGDARDRATLLGAQQGQQDRQQAINELLLQRNEPLQELAAANGSAPKIPQFGATPSGGNVQPTDYLNAAGLTGQANNDIYNANMGNYNSLLQTGGGLASSAAMMMAMGSMF